MWGYFQVNSTLDGSKIFVPRPAGFTLTSTNLRIASARLSALIAPTLPNPLMQEAVFIVLSHLSQLSPYACMFYTPTPQSPIGRMF